MVSCTDLGHSCPRPAGAVADLCSDDVFCIKGRLTDFQRTAYHCRFVSVLHLPFSVESTYFPMGAYVVDKLFDRKPPEGMPWIVKGRKRMLDSSGFDGRDAQQLRSIAQSLVTDHRVSDIHKELWRSFAESLRKGQRRGLEPEVALYRALEVYKKEHGHKAYLDEMQNALNWRSVEPLRVNDQGTVIDLPVSHLMNLQSGRFALLFRAAMGSERHSWAKPLRALGSRTGFPVSAASGDWYQLWRTWLDQRLEQKSGRPAFFEEATGEALRQPARSARAKSCAGDGKPGESACRTASCEYRSRGCAAAPARRLPCRSTRRCSATRGSASACSRSCSRACRPDATQV